LDAKEPLRRARNVFDELGLRPWADEARAELRATGETGRRRTVGIGEQLSAQELQIATLAADGLMNRQIAERINSVQGEPAALGSRYRDATVRCDR
jgi:DNA-binding NarL/FixJ family response regulator